MKSRNNWKCQLGTNWSTISKLPSAKAILFSDIASILQQKDPKRFKDRLGKTNRNLKTRAPGLEGHSHAMRYETSSCGY